MKWKISFTRKSFPCSHLLILILTSLFFNWASFLLSNQKVSVLQFIAFSLLFFNAEDSANRISHTYVILHYDRWLLKPVFHLILCSITFFILGYGLKEITKILMLLSFKQSLLPPFGSTIKLLIHWTLFKLQNVHLKTLISQKVGKLYLHTIHIECPLLLDIAH